MRAQSKIIWTFGLTPRTRKLWVALAVYLFTTVQAAAAPPQVDGIYERKGNDDKQLRLILKQNGSSVNGIFIQLKKGEFWRVVGTVSDNGGVSMTRLIPKEELGSEDNQRIALAKYGTDDGKFLKANVTLGVQPQ